MLHGKIISNMDGYLDRGNIYYLTKIVKLIIWMNYLKKI